MMTKKSRDFLGDPGPYVRDEFYQYDTVEALSAKIQKEAGLEYPPTAFTIPFRLAMSGEGDRAHEWEDKPHRLIYDLCEELERIAVKPFKG